MVTNGLVLTALSMVNFIGILNISIVNVALTPMGQDLNTDMAGLQWVLNAFTICLSALTLAGGSLGDKFGRKRVFIFGIVAFIAGSTICALSVNLGMLITGRVVQGIAAAAMIPGSLSILSHTFTDATRRARAIGVWASVTAIGLSIGPVAGGLLIDLYDWPALFWISVGGGLIALAATVAFIPESSDPGATGLDPLGQVLAILSLGALSFGLIQLGQETWSDPLGLTALTSGVVLLAVFIAAQLRHPAPMLPIRLFGNLRFATLNYASAALGFGPYAVYAFLAIFLQQEVGLSAMAAGLTFLPMSAATAIVAPLAGRWVGSVGADWPMMVGYSASAAGLGGVMLLDTQTPWWWTTSTFVLIGIGMGLSMTPTTNAAVAAVARERSGIAAATINTTRQTGLALGIALLGALLASQEDFITGLHLVAAITAVVSLVAVSLVLLIRARERAAARAGLADTAMSGRSRD